MIETVMKFEPESREDVAKELEGAYQLSKKLGEVINIPIFTIQYGVIPPQIGQ